MGSTEVELFALSEAGKLALYVRSILNELGMSQHVATSVYEDNKGCLHMTQNQKPTKKQDLLTYNILLLLIGLHMIFSW